MRSKATFKKFALFVIEFVANLIIEFLEHFSQSLAAKALQSEENETFFIRLIGLGLICF